MPCCNYSVRMTGNKIRPNREIRVMKINGLLFGALIFIPLHAIADSKVYCSYAPSQSSAVAAVSGAAGGAGVTAGAIASATGLTVVTHSSGALILTGSSGYVAGTLGTTAAAIASAPVVVAVGVVVGGSAVTLELVCATENHPDQVEKVKEAANEFSERFSEKMKLTQVAVGDMRASITPVANKTAGKVKDVATDIWDYAYQRGAELGDVIRK